MRALGAARARVLHVRAPEPPCPTVASPRSFWPLPSHSLHARPLPRRRAALAPSWRPTAPPLGRPWQQAGGRSSPCHGRRRPSHTRVPAALWSSPSLSKNASASARRHHAPPCCNRTAVRRRSYPRPRNRPSCAINGGPELIQTPRQPQAISLEPPFPPVGQKPFPSPSPASSAAAALRSSSSQVELLPSI